MAELPLAALVVGVAVLAFVFSIRVGILLGHRLDRVLEARAAAEKVPQTEEVGVDE